MSADLFAVAPPAREVKSRPTPEVRTGLAWPVRSQRRPPVHPCLADALACLDRARAAGRPDDVLWCVVALLYWLDDDGLGRVAGAVEGLLRPPAREVAA